MTHRSGRAGLPHPALQLVGSRRGWRKATRTCLGTYPCRPRRAANPGPLVPESASRRADRSPSGAPVHDRGVSAGFSRQGTSGGVCSRSCSGLTSTFLRPFAPPALPGFDATMDALTPVRPALRPVMSGNEHRPKTEQVSRIHPPDLPSVPSPTTWCVRPSLYHATLQRGRLPRTLWPPVWVSPLTSRLTTTPGRIEFVLLRTARSPPVAPHPASRRRSYGRLQTGERLSGEDLHLPDRVNFPSH